MRNKLGIACMCLGAVLLGSALLLFLWNDYEANQAQKAAEEILPDMIKEIERAVSSEDEPLPDPFDPTMKEVTIEGNSYIGYLSIPSLDLELPIMSSWDMQRMRIAPCRYFGAVKSKNFVIAGHNYAGHFGGLQKLNIGDYIRFTDMLGDVTVYRVYELETLPPTAVEEMTAGDAALTLFTCTYSGQARITVRCEIVEN